MKAELDLPPSSALQIDVCSSGRAELWAAVSRSAWSGAGDCSLVHPLVQQLLCQTLLLNGKAGTWVCPQQEGGSPRTTEPCAHPSIAPWSTCGWWGALRCRRVGPWGCVLFQELMLPWRAESSAALSPSETWQEVTAGTLPSPVLCVTLRLTQWAQPKAESGSRRTTGLVGTETSLQ